MRNLAFGLVVAICVAAPLQPLVAQEPSTGLELSPADYEVAAAVLGAEYPPEGNKPVMVATQTATFDCNPPVDNGFAIGGCSGMRSADISPEAVIRNVRAAIPSIAPELSRQLLQVGKASATLAHKLPTSVPQFLYGKGVTEKPSRQPEMAFYMSRPAIAKDGAHALIYVGTVSWRDQSKSLGRYFYLEKTDDQWAIKGQFVIWQLGV